MKKNIEKEHSISFKEFKAWLTGLIRGKRGELPDIDDWKQIKVMMDKVTEKTEHSTLTPLFNDDFVSLKNDDIYDTYDSYVSGSTFSSAALKHFLEENKGQSLSLEVQNAEKPTLYDYKI